MSTVAREPTTDFDFDISSLEFWMERTPAERDSAFRTLREQRPLSWWGPVESLTMPPEMVSGGYWALTRYEDIRQVSRDANTFCSGEGIMFFDAPPELFEATTSCGRWHCDRHRLRLAILRAERLCQVLRLGTNVTVAYGQAVGRCRGAGGSAGSHGCLR